VCFTQGVETFGNIFPILPSFDLDRANIYEDRPREAHPPVGVVKRNERYHVWVSNDEKMRLLILACAEN